MDLEVRRPERAELSEEETLKRMEEFPKRQEAFLAAILAGKAHTEAKTAMASATISIAVDPDVARAFAAASAEERRKLELLLNLRLRELTTAPRRSLQAIMDDIGAEAAARGMTPEILESLLHDE